MVLFKKIRPRRGSLAVSIICGSPMAASSRSAAFAYRIGSPRHDSRYSAIDISVSLRASKDLAKALKSESLYMIPLLIRSAAGRDAEVPRRRGPARIENANQHQHIDPFDTRPTPSGNAIVVLRRPSSPKYDMISTRCNPAATSGEVLAPRP